MGMGLFPPYGLEVVVNQARPLETFAVFNLLVFWQHNTYAQASISPSGSGTVVYQAKSLQTV